MLVTILDYGAGNLHSLGKALALTGAAIRVASDPLRVLDGDVLVLPGVGGFGPAARQVAPARRVIRAAILAGHPTIGVCLGMQLLFDASDEAPGEGLAVIPGRVTRLRSARVPHMGWNTVEECGPLTDALDDATEVRGERSGVRVGDQVFFANSYACRPDDTGVVQAWCEHDDDRFPAMVRVANAVGVQFHPEKSGREGISLLAALVKEVACS